MEILVSWTWLLLDKVVKYEKLHIYYQTLIEYGIWLKVEPIITLKIWGLRKKEELVLNEIEKTAKETGFGIKSIV